MSVVLKKTTCASLQTHLDQWVVLVDAAISCTNPSIERADAIMAFCKAFVPADVSEDDIDHFSGMLSSDEVIGTIEIVMVSDAFVHLLLPVNGVGTPDFNG